MSRIAISIGFQRMTVVSKDDRGKVHLTQFMWWHDGAGWCSRATWVVDCLPKSKTQELMTRHDTAGALMASLSFEAGCDVKL